MATSTFSGPVVSVAGFSSGATSSFGPVSTSSVTTNTVASLGATGVVVGSTAGNKVAFFGLTPVVQPASPAGVTGGFTVGTGATVTNLSVFTGGTGSTAYNISDVVKALKTLGLLAA